MAGEGEQPCRFGTLALYGKKFPQLVEEEEARAIAWAMVALAGATAEETVARMAAQWREGRTLLTAPASVAHRFEA